MKKLVTFLLILFKINAIIACCGARKYRLFPLGRDDKGIVIASFDLSRKCERGKMFKEFHWIGEVRLSYYQGDSLKIISILDTIDFYQTNNRDTAINYLVQFYDSIMPYYQNALNKARKLKGFKETKLISYEYHKDTLPINDISIINDTTLLVKNNKVILFPIFWGSCGFYNDITELRIYEVAGKKIRIVSLACERVSLISDEVIHFNQNNFMYLDNAYMVNKVEWHGESYDYIIPD